MNISHSVVLFIYILTLNTLQSGMFEEVFNHILSTSERSIQLCNEVCPLKNAEKVHLIRKCSEQVVIDESLKKIINNLFRSIV